MTMSFYIGKDYRIYEQKYKVISIALMKEMERKRIKITKAAVFRFLIDKIHDSKLLDKILDNIENNNKEA